MKTLVKRLLKSLTVCILLSTVSVNAQVTIGSKIKPNPGALLDLKETDSPAGESNSKRGLLLPRVELKDLRSLQMGNKEDINEGDKPNLTGLMVYNTTKRETSDRICPGVHIWNGNSWEPMLPYPTFVLEEREITPDLTDIRNQGQETNTYKTAHFKSLKSGNIYSCNPGEEFVYVDAGVWMVENLNTRYFPDGTTILRNAANSYSIPQYYEPNYAGTDASRIKLNGLLYNWAAATNKKGGENGTDYPDSEENKNDQTIVQGICPEGWHLPSDYEWRQLTEAISLQPELYTTSSSLTSNSDIGRALKLPNEPYTAITNQGISKSASEGGFAAISTGFANNGSAKDYGVSYFFWTSSSLNATNSFNRAFRNSNSKYEEEGSARNNMFPVRCIQTE